MFQLLHSLASKLQFLVRGLLSLLHEGVNDHDAFADQEAVESSPNTRPSPRTKFKKTVTHRTGVRQTKIRPVLRQQLDQVRIVREHVNWPGLKLSEYARMEVPDLVGHGPNVSKNAN